MSQLTKQQLKGENQTQFPNNNVGAITPSHLRAFNVDMIDSTVNQTDFTNFSGSVASEFANLTASVDPSITGSSLITASFDNGTRNLTFTKGDASTFAVNIPDVSGSTLNTGSFATTGSNTFIGIQTFQDGALNATSLVSTSGSLMLVAKTFNSSSTHITASAGNQVNLIFKNSNNNRDTIVSGSNNIFTNPPSTGIAGFKAYMGSANIMLTTGAGTDSFSYITASAQFSPTLNNNILNGGAITMRCPVSASWTIQRNALIGGGFNFGTTTVPNPGINNLTCQNNVVAGTLNVTAPFNLATGTTFNASFLNGIANLNLNSSSIAMAQCNINGTFTFINNSFTGGAGTGSLAMNRCNFGGTNTITARNAGTASSYSDNVMFGQSNQVAIDLSQTNNAFNGNNILGTNLIVTASGVFPDPDNKVGSMFTGRYNAVDGNKALTAQTVFAVGTGTTTTRKTGFLIDSGSNTFIEGTLNVSGSSTLSGSLYIQSGSTLPVSTGSAILTWDAATGQVKQASYSTIISASVSSAEFWSTITQSGSAGVSGSLSFNNSGSFYNVSVVNGTQLTLANAGVYNIQFSAQLETSAGADTVYVWFKKNGNNISDSASKAVLANNTAQIMTVNILDEAQANDYYEIAYQNINGHATILAEAASGNIPAIPSVIATVMQVR